MNVDHMRAVKRMYEEFGLGAREPGKSTQRPQVEQGQCTCYSFNPQNLHMTRASEKDSLASSITGREFRADPSSPCIL